MKLFSKLSIVYTIVVFDAIFIAVVASSLVNYLTVINLGMNVMGYFAIVLHLILPILVLCFIKFSHRRQP